MSDEGPTGLRAAMEMKERLVARDGIGTDLPPMLQLLHDGVVLACFLTGWETEEERTLMLAKTAAIVAASDATSAVFVVESFMLRPEVESLTEAEDIIDGLNFGDLAKRFAAGDRAVSETITVCALTAEGEGWFASQSYTYAGRTVLWGDDLITTEQEPGSVVEGGVLHALRRGFEIQATRPVPALALEEIAAMLEVDMVAPVTAPLARNEPCPCGSGLKAKRCCWNA